LAYNALPHADLILKLEFTELVKRMNAYYALVSGLFLKHTVTTTMAKAIIMTRHGRGLIHFDETPQAEQTIVTYCMPGDHYIIQMSFKNNNKTEHDTCWSQPGAYNGATLISDTSFGRIRTDDALELFGYSVEENSICGSLQKLEIQEIQFLCDIRTESAIGLNCGHLINDGVDMQWLVDEIEALPPNSKLTTEQYEKWHDIYEEESRKVNNCVYVPTHFESLDIPIIRVVTTKTVNKGEEFTVAYGIIRWVCMIVATNKHNIKLG
jgi:hypothetical protein